LNPWLRKWVFCCNSCGIHAPDQCPIALDRLAWDDSGENEHYIRRTGNGC
jgi:hypothetical protein